MNTLRRYDLMRINSTEHGFDKVGMVQLMKRLLKTIKEDIAELVDIHLHKYFYHSLVVIAFDGFTKRDRV